MSEAMQLDGNRVKAIDPKTLRSYLDAKNWETLAIAFIPKDRTAYSQNGVRIDVLEERNDDVAYESSVALAILGIVAVENRNALEVLETLEDVQAGQGPRRLPQSYYRLVREFPLITITGDFHHQTARLKIQSMITRADLDRGETEYLSALQELVWAYEESLDDYDPDLDDADLDDEE